MGLVCRYLVLTALLISLSACTTVLVDNSSWGRSGPDNRTPSQIEQDSQINAAVVSKLIHDASIDSTRIQVNTRGGVVSLTGQVASQAQFNRAVSLARSAAGVRSVVPRLVIVR